MNSGVETINKINFPGHRRRGVSLVELLVVMAVVVLLAGLTLPSFRSMLQDQRVTQTARVVQGMAESARARAIALGRPVALILDRVQVDPSAPASFNVISDNTCTRLSIGEVFPPYEGDWSGATGSLTDVYDAATGKAQPDGVPETLVIDIAKVSSMIDLTTYKPNGLVEVGDLLQLSDHSQLFSISEISCPTSTIVNVRFNNPPAGFSTAEPLWSTTADNVRFRMTRRPTKTMAGSTPLPRGMCIDLYESGIGVAGNELAVGTRPASSFVDRFGPIFIVFNARGNVDGTYYRLHDSTYEPIAISPTGVMHMLVGRTEQVAPGGATTASDRDDFVPNLFDARNVWVSINPYSGAIYSAPNASVTPTTVPAVASASDRAAARVFAINVLDAKGS